MRVVGISISRFVSWIAAFNCILLMCLVAHVTLDVVMRYVFNMPLHSTILFVSVYYMVAIAFLPLAVIEEKNDHIAVELLTKRFPDNIQKLLLVISTILTSIVTALVAARTGQEALTQYNNGAFSMEAGRKVLIWPSYFFLPIGFAMISVVAAWKAIAILTGKKSGLSTLSIEGSYIPKDLTK
ncbi:TRAP transporter small permease [Paracoccaceae bacterium]|nr:TRAP transporter small permease [Paracoccaceae bacterium]